MEVTTMETAEIETAEQVETTGQKRGRTVKLTVRVKPDEHERLTEQARERSISTSALLRMSALGKRLPTVGNIPDSVRRDISRWSQNLNQLAHKANAGGAVSVQAVQALRAEARRLLKQIVDNGNGGN
jgi:Mobilization protein NikA